MQKCFLRIFFIISVSVAGYIAHAQDPFSVSYTISDGLPSTNIYSVFQQKDGIIWFTTDVGIVKYNSKSFELYNTDNGLSDNEVFKLVPDQKGRLWMMTVNGKPAFIFNNKIYNENNSELLKKIRGSGMLVDIYGDDKKNVYLAFKNGDVYKIDKNDAVSSYNFYPQLLFGMWTNNGTYVLTGNLIIDIANKTKTQSAPHSFPYRVYHTATKTFISSKNKLYVPQQGAMVAYMQLDESTDIVNVIEEGSNLWICTRNGLYLWSEGRCINYYFKDHLVSDSLKDAEGNYWITTLNKGVLFVPSFEVKQLLSEKKLNCLGVSPNNELWIGGFENDIYIKKNTGVAGRTLNSSWSKNKISNIRFYGDTCFVAAKSGIEMNSKGSTTTYRSSINDIVPSGGFFFIATTFTARIKKTEVNATSIGNIYTKTILQKRTNVLCKDNAGNIWMGTNFGLFRYNTKDSITDFGERFNDLAISIEDLYFDTENNLLLVGTASKGLVVLKDNQFVKKINSLNGLNSNTINTIKKIGSNVYLLGSNNGINKVVLAGDTGVPGVFNYNANFGFKNNRIKDIEVLDDTVYLAMDHGLLYFNTNYLDIKTVRPKCIITDVETAFENNNSINYKNNSVSFSFQGVSYLDLGDVQYFYKLENQDREWSSTKETQINYKSLPAGKYRFNVYCVNGFGQKSDIQQADFKILPPFWQTWWFRIMAVLVILWCVYIIFRFRLKKQRVRFEKEKVKIGLERDKAQMEKQMVELEQRALRMQMNPHFIFNALNTIKGYYAEGNFLNASNYISKFSKLLRKLLESEEQVTTLDNEIEMLRLYIELTQIRYEGKFDYAISVSNNVLAEEILIPNLLLQPLVENAVIYGLGPKTKKGFLLIDFLMNDGMLICTVDDNGIGRERAMKNQKNKEYKSKATNITLERLALFDKRSKMEYFDKVENDHAAGTKVIITIPIKKVDDDENINN